jgi:hypothetical protein
MAAMQFCFSEVCGFFSELRVLQFLPSINTCILIAESYNQNKKDFSLSFLFFVLIGMI